MGKKSQLRPVLKDEKDPAKSLNTLVEVGAEFDSFDNLDLAIKAYEAENLVNLIVRDTRTIESALKRNRRKNYNPALKYSDVCYCCTFGGKKYQSRSTGKRTHKSTKQACPFNLKLRATLDGQRLFVREMCATHNHEISEAEFRLHPKQRKLDHTSQDEIATLLTLEPDKKLLREKLMQVTGKVILMKDIHNIKTRHDSAKVKDQIVQDIDNFVNVAQEGDEKDLQQHSQMSVVELVDNLTSESGQLAHDDSNLHEGKQELLPGSISIEIPISQISSCELSSVLNTIVNTAADGMAEDGSTHSENSSQTARADPAVIVASSEFSPPSSIFPCPIDSFTHQPHEAYQVNAQPLLPEVISIAAPSPSSLNLNEHSTSMDSRHQSFHALEDVNNIGINILQSLQPWQDIDSHNSERTSFQTATVLSNSHENIHIINPHTSISLPSDDVSKMASSDSHAISLCLKSHKGDASSLSHTTQHLRRHLQQQQQQQPQRIVEEDRGRSTRSSQLRKTKARRNPIESDKEAIKKKYFQQASVNLFFNERFSFRGNKHRRDRPFTSGAGKMSDSNTTDFHEMLKPLSWLFGTWQGKEGKCIYPTMEDFPYAEIVEFCPVPSQPIVGYKFFSTKTDGSTPMHREIGFIKIDPDTNLVAFIAAHNLGMAEIQEGEVKDGELMVETKELANISFNKPPFVKKIRRTLVRTGDELEHVLNMQTDRTELTEHLRITYRKFTS